MTKFIPHTEEKHKEKKELVDFLLKYIMEDDHGRPVLKLKEEYEADILLFKDIQGRFVLSIEDRTLPVFATWFLEND